MSGGALAAAQAQAQTGLSNWSDLTFEERFGLVVDHINSIPMDETGRKAAPANNKGDRQGKFEYSTRLLTDAGYGIDALNEEFAAFRERFDVEIEVT